MSTRIDVLERHTRGYNKNEKKIVGRGETRSGFIAVGKRTDQ